MEKRTAVDASPLHGLLAAVSGLSMGDRFVGQRQTGAGGLMLRWATVGLTLPLGEGTPKA